MRGTTFGRLVEMARAEARLTVNPAAGLNINEHLKQIVSRVYENLWDEVAWPHLEQAFQITLQQGEVLYDVPEGATQERLLDKDAFATYPNESRRWPVVSQEIGWQHYNQLDPKMGQTLDPVRFWCVRPDDRIEVWPAPATDTAVLSLKGIRKVAPLVQNGDVCELDDRLVVLFAAGEILGDKGQNKQIQAQRLLQRLQGSARKRRVFSMLSERASVLPPRRVEVMYVPAGNGSGGDDGLTGLI
jgi:hypothetical protein